MLYSIKNQYLSYSINELGQVCSVRNERTGHEYCTAPGELFRLIYKFEDFEERPVDAAEQDPPQIHVNGDEMTVVYPTLNTRNGVQQIRLEFTMTLKGDTMYVVSHIQNNSEVEVMELQTTALAGVGTLGGDPNQDALMTPYMLGRKIEKPYTADFFKYSTLFKKKYERPDNIHSDLDLPYPGYSCMQWFALYNDNECLYVGNEDVNHELHKDGPVALIPDVFPQVCVTGGFGGAGFVGLLMVMSLCAAEQRPVAAQIVQNTVSAQL